MAYEIGPSGKLEPKKHYYTELATGMHYQKDGNWEESSEQIDILANGTAVAIHGQHKVTFPGDVYKGVIELITPDGRHLKSRPMGLSYFDGTNSVLIAELKSSVGVAIGNNQVIYPDAFTDFKADLVYTYTKAGLEQDVVIKEQPPLPEKYSLNLSNTRLQLLTEFFDTAGPSVARSTADKQVGLTDDTLSFGQMKMVRGKAFSVGDAAQTTSRSRETAVYKSWQSMQGRQFLVEELPVQIIGEQLDQLPMPAGGIQPASPTPPVRRKAAANRQLTPLRLTEASTNKLYLAKARPDYKSGFVMDYSMVLSQTNYTFQGDMTYYVSGNVNLAGVTTIEGGTVIKYYTNSGSIDVLGTVNCLTAPYRPAILTSFNDTRFGEPISIGSSPCLGTLSLRIENNWTEDIQEVSVWNYNGNSPVNNDYIVSGNYSNYVFIAGLGQHYSYFFYDTYWNEYYGDFWPMLDNGKLELSAAGDPIYTESGANLCTPPVFGSTIALSLANGGGLHDLRVYNMDIGIASSDDYSVTDSQFLHCKTALKTENAFLYSGNLLMSDVGTGFFGQNFQAQVEHLTFDQGTHVTDGPAGAETNSVVALTNCLITAVTDYGIIPAYTNHVVKLTSGAGVYQVVGGGSYYLTNNTYRNIGTTNIAPDLLSVIRTTTTYPPSGLYFNTTISNATTFSPQVQRDTDTPDLGYHYNPLDYVLSSCILTTNLTVSAGTVVGFFDNGSPGMTLRSGANLTFMGTASAPCWGTEFKSVQECGNGNWIGSPGSGLILFNGSSATSMPQLNATFTKWPAIVYGEQHVSDYGCFGFSANYGIGTFSHCEFYNTIVASYRPSLYFTNCLFDRVYTAYWDQQDAASFAYQNCTFFNGFIAMCRYSGQSASFWTIKNTMFDGTGFLYDDNFHANTNHAYFDYNAYNTNNNSSWATYNSGYWSDPTLETNGTHDVIINISFIWQSSWFGDFYQITNSPLINAGSPTADQVGLYHFTTQTNQIKEASSIVDIGYHYVAVDASGNPIDSDGDTIADYLEDANGNGLADSGETDWRYADVDGDGIPDNWEIWLGLNPSVNDWSQSTERANYTYTLADWLDEVFGIRSGTVNLDNEGNVLSISQ